MTVQDTLLQRGTRYGQFDQQAQVAQELKGVAVRNLNLRQRSLAYDQAEALDMIFHKIARIINGDPNYADSWHDIAGYATLVEQRLVAEQPEAPSVPDVQALHTETAPRRYGPLLQLPEGSN